MPFTENSTVSAANNSVQSGFAFSNYSRASRGIRENSPTRTSCSLLSIPVQHVPARPTRTFSFSNTAADETPLYSIRTFLPYGDSGQSSNNSNNTLKDESFSGISSFQIVGEPRFALTGSLQQSHKQTFLPAPIPRKKGGKMYRWLRWSFGSVYRRIFTVAFVANAVVLVTISIRYGIRASQLSYKNCANGVAANLLAALAIRNEHIINMLFRLFVGGAAERLPLCLRHLCAKVYSYGGIHSGCGVAAVLWHVTYLVTATQQLDPTPNPLVRGYVLFSAYGSALCLALILIFAHPIIRTRIHNWFEGVHRFAGWTAITLFWIQVLALASDEAMIKNMSIGTACLHTPAFWMLVFATLLLIYPWTRLRLRDVEVEPMNEHVTKLNFSYRNVQFGQAIRLANQPLRETHAFAVIPNPAAAISDIGDAEKSDSIVPAGNVFSNAGKRGFSVLISHAGDWTRRIIDNPPKKLYTRGVPQFGVLRVAGLFRPCIVAATGSGIGPCLSLFVQRPDHPVRIIWSAKQPKETYGAVVIDQLRRADPKAVIFDTHKTGRPDLVIEIWRIWEASRNLDGGRNACEAVVLISNQSVTRKVVYGLESRGIPAYGAIFDS